MSSIVRSIKKKQGKTCLFSCLKTVFEFHCPEKVFSEEEILTLGMGYKFRYGYYYQGHRSVLPSMSCFHLNLDFEQLSQYSCFHGINIEGKKSNDVDDLMGKIQNDLHLNYPVIVAADCSHLSYWPKDLDGNKGRYILCYGLDLENEKVYILDQAIYTSPKNSFQGSVNLCEFKKALNLKDVIEDNDFVSWHFSPSKMQKAKKIKDSDKLNLLYLSASSMLQESSQKYIFGNTTAVYQVGLVGLRYFFDELFNAFEDRDVSNLLYKYYEILTSFGGVSRSRHLIHSYLLQVLGKDDLLLNELGAIDQKWQIMANLLFKSSRKPTVALRERLKKLADHLIDKEAKIVELFLKRAH